MIWTPPSLPDVFRARYAAIEAAERDRGLQREILQLAAIDPVWWVNNWVWTYDPRLEGQKSVPMVLFPRQSEYIGFRRDRYAARENFATEKSRDMGITWCNAADQLHHWLFEQGFKGTFGSRKEGLVDKKGDPDSIFSKLRFMLDWLPPWMLPAGFKRSEHDNLLRLVNPATGSAITGEGGDNMGRGGRSSLYDLDEWAFVENADSVDSAVSQNSDCIGYSSTAHGQGNNFHRKVMDGKIAKFTFHWRDDPRKGPEWYQKQIDTLDAVVVAQEIDIDYTASIEGILIPRGWCEAAWGRDAYTAERSAISIGGDIAEAGGDKCAAVIREGRNILHLEEWHDPDATISKGKFVALGLEYEKRLLPHHKLYFFIDAIGVGSGIVGELRNWVKANERAKWVIVGVKTSERSPEELCNRLRDALWWRMRYWFRDKEPAVAVGIDTKARDQLTNEISSITYTQNESGLIVVEGKRDLKKRGIKSPNLGDALMHTFDWEAMKGEPKPDTWRERQQTDTRWI